MTLPKSDISNALDDSDYFGDRVRRLSNASMESNERYLFYLLDPSLTFVFVSSSFSTFTYPHSSSATAFRMDTISSDVESNAGSVVDSLPDNTPKEQVKHKIHTYLQANNV